MTLSTTPDDGPTRWLARPDADAWLSLVAVLELLPAALDSQLQHDSQLTFFEFLVLAQLADTPQQRLRLSDLGAATNAPLPRISRVAAKLEQDGWVQRRPHASDGRGREVALTDGGRQKLASAARGHIALVNRLFVDQLSDRQMAMLRESCERIIDALDPAREFNSPTLAGLQERPGLSSEPACQTAAELPQR